MSEKITVSFAQDHGISRQAVAGPQDPTSVMGLDHPGRAFIDRVDQIDADCVVAGSRKTGPGDHDSGATALPVVRHIPCAMHVPR